MAEKWGIGGDGAMAGGTAIGGGGVGGGGGGLVKVEVMLSGSLEAKLMEAVGVTAEIKAVAG